jgi:hypothetical protein
MTQRKVTVFNMGDNSSRSVMTSAETWGALKTNHSEVRGMLVEDMKVVIKQTKAVVETDGAVLPDGDVTIYLTPGKVKSGAKKTNYRTEFRNRITPVVKIATEKLLKDLANLKKGVEAL